MQILFLLAALSACSGIEVESRIAERSFSEIIVQAGLLSGAVEWKGTAPLCSGACSFSERQVLRASDAFSLSTVPAFGQPCSFGSGKALCTSQYRSCLTESQTLEIQCEHAEGYGGDIRPIAYYTRCALVNAPSTLCASSRQTVAVSMQLDVLAGAWYPGGYPGGFAKNPHIPPPYKLQARAQVWCCS
ncbi:hypothetical protein CALVIDRAFT_530657 [Calocera viscosa TUFC12733]|uniref:Uncharacterized protein n=1 Tax=Calocera viscosa (strain TUFC12733) TaxID=1330018 RepID=A0A167HJW3_CALVF|nr:hypothetical protein CALVIDRAFT_530657 [Calocera viscosa TUFC12733]